VVTDSFGTGNAPVNNAGAQNLDIAAKTGTAETISGAQPDSVFTAFAPADNPQIAVGVIVQAGGYGATTAGPIAVSVIKALLG
jgi:penicillin-binding protein A